MNSRKEPESALKYLIFNLHDTNVSNFLRFLGYWTKYGYQKHVRFASSVRLEVFKTKSVAPKRRKDYKIRFVYDNEEIRLDFCKDWYCTFDEF